MVRFHGGDAEREQDPPDRTVFVDAPLQHPRIL